MASVQMGCLQGFFTLNSPGRQGSYAKVSIRPSLFSLFLFPQGFVPRKPQSVLLLFLLLICSSRTLVRGMESGFVQLAVSGGFSFLLSIIRFVLNVKTGSHV